MINASTGRGDFDTARVVAATLRFPPSSMLCTASLVPVKPPQKQERKAPKNPADQGYGSQENDHAAQPLTASTGEPHNFLRDVGPHNFARPVWDAFWLPALH